MAREVEGDAGMTGRKQRGGGALMAFSLLAVLVGLVSALAPVAIEKYRYGNDGALACQMGQDAPAGFDGYVDLVHGTFVLFPARVDCRWQMPDGLEVRTARSISSGSAPLALACGGFGLAGVAVATLRLTRHR